MKNFTLILILVSGFLTHGLSQGTETLTNLNASGSSYTNGSFTGDNSVLWSYERSRTVTSTYNITGTSIGFADSGTRFLSANSGSGGVGSITFSIRSYFTGGNASDRTIEVLVNNISQGSFTLSSMGVVETETINSINQTGDVEIRFRSTGSRQIVLDDISWTGFAACTAPSTQASNFSASSITTNSMNISWDHGNGDRVLVVAKDLQAVNADPSNGTSYTADANFGDGDEIGTGNFVVFDGAGTSPASGNVTVTGLNSATIYHFAIYSYNATDDCYNLDQLIGNATTSGPDIQLQYPISTDVDCGSLTIDFGGHEVGVGTNSLTFRIENTGDADLTLTLPLTIGGTNAGDYTITTQPAATIGASSFSDVTVEFAPAATGTRTASIDITSNDPDESPCTVDLTGLGAIENDECNTAISLTVNSDESCTSSTSGTTIGGSDSGLGAISCNSFTGNANDDVWYSFTATATTHSVSVTAGAGFDAVVDIRSGACDGTNIACADDNGSGGDEEVDVSGLSIGVTYYVRIYSFGTTAGTFDVCINTPAPPANPGDVVINEFMAAPVCASNTVGEYVELYNTTASPINIDGWTLSDNDSDSHTFSSANGTTTIPAGGYLLCAISSSATYFGFTPAYDYSSFVLANGTDEIVLSEGSTEICRVDYSNGDPFGSGVSLQLPEGYDYSLADDGEILASEYIGSDNEFGCGDLGTPNAANFLPVNLLSFTAKTINATTLLSFSTATEESNSHFLIQRSSDGKIFETIGRIEGKGDSNQPVDYQFTDTKPAMGINYYRLQQFDFDGTNEYFGPISVRFQSEPGTAPSIWPVPARDRLEVSLPDENSAEWLIEVYDLNGRRVIQQNLEEKTRTTSLDISQLPTGSYLFRWLNGQSNGQQRFVKQ